ncbi:MAG: RNA methyltransferase [Desulfurococcaceae archaeon]
MKYRTYFVLRGDNEHLARGELRALLEVFGEKCFVECYPMLCLSDCSEVVATGVTARAGFVKEAGRVIGVFNVYSEGDAREAGVVLGGVAHVSVFKSTVSSSAVEEFKRRAGVVEKIGGLGEKRLIFTSGLAVAGVKLSEQSYGELLKRARSLPFRRSISLTPDLARALVNLSRARRGCVLVDPFAGTGMILVEAWSMGVRGVAVDVDWRLVKGMKQNFEHLGVNAVPVVGDSRYSVFGEVDHVATDLPYGRGASTHGAEIRELYRLFFERLSEYLSRRGYACFMAPLWLEDYVDDVLDSSGFKLVGRYYDYVHSSLTRSISVVVRK